MIYIRKTRPNYEYKSSDFLVLDNGGDIKVEWSEKFDIEKPKIRDLINITEDEIRNFEMKKTCRAHIDVVDDLEHIDCPHKGAIVFCNGKLYIYDSEWIAIG